ncbi:hypothetical protein OIE68_00845 [Nocardia vinacea]|uniref:hypothetical protein n=1 Tax=Nocardia vinacea TaxID=96468 RepID=UPI002E11753B|nr:hypothetical protein OIE68_00845 [Nocardia vinacea]
MYDDADNASDFISRIAERFPRLAEDLECHIENDGGPLAHVFLGMYVTPAVVSAFLGEDGEFKDLNWQGLIHFLSTEFEKTPLGGEVRAAIGTSFLMHLPWPSDPGYHVVDRLGPTLREKFDELRPAG